MPTCDAEQYLTMMPRRVLKNKSGHARNAAHRRPQPFGTNEYAVSQWKSKVLCVNSVCEVRPIVELPDSVIKLLHT